jgi:hypothetical protein
LKYIIRKNIDYLKAKIKIDKESNQDEFRKERRTLSTNEM